ncbi:hypothetical protein [Rubinisphaera italica]|uniref:Uncharacterized protein n=1 Tax=Rubinisphaera italica TaxID=2527969 RepID=A0A5C5XP80_9PLAN|nr:hypothetical protein [Rubinisphaera italica]TWT64261.1 hypothetical protein Pan54_50220 [Rubinisphaera italica]
MWMTRTSKKRLIVKIEKTLGLKISQGDSAGDYFEWRMPCGHRLLHFTLQQVDGEWWLPEIIFPLEFDDNALDKINSELSNGDLGEAFHLGNEMTGLKTYLLGNRHGNESWLSFDSPKIFNIIQCRLIKDEGQQYYQLDKNGFVVPSPTITKFRGK